MDALRCKFGHHRRSIYRIEFENGKHNNKEYIQEFAADVEPLVHSAHSKSPELMENCKIDVSAYGVEYETPTLKLKL